jgi:2-polyprenyl-3-methyl-5-hydroxy-6-metoxy-1,4-benzoquinol methylase
MANDIQKPTRHAWQSSEASINFLNILSEKKSCEFQNIVKLPLLMAKLNLAIYEYKKAEILDVTLRKNLLAEYYGVSVSIIESLVVVNYKERNELCWEAGINPYIFRTLCDYNRYTESFSVFNYLFSEKIEFTGLKVLDFGCLVSDYGYFFGMLGSVITFCDFQEYIDFADFRLGKANINRVKVLAPADIDSLIKGQDLTIFGEVLEHLEDPYSVLKCCIVNRVKCVFTSCYPYGNESYFSLSGHTKSAKEQSQICINLMRDNYKEIDMGKLARLWVAK